MTGRAVILVGALVCSALACTPEKPKELVSRAEFGIFFGGQIQERGDIPFELDPTRQTQGFRVEFGAPVTSEVTVQWRVDRPAAAAPKPRRAPVPSATPPDARTTTGVAVVRVGEARLDQALPFRPGDPLGLWNVRVVVQDRVVIDRAFEVYDAAARAKAERRDGG